MKRSFLLYCVYFPLNLILMSCSSSVYNFNVKILKPAELNLGTVNKIAVSGFKGRRGDVISNNFTAKLVESQAYKIIERSELDKILKEQGLSQSGVIDENNAVQIGKLAGVDALIFGSVDLLEVDDFQSSTKITKNVPVSYTLDKDGNKNYQYEKQSFNAPTVTRKGNLTLTFKAVNVASGQIVAMRNVNKTWEGKNIQDPRPEYRTAINLFEAGALDGSIELPGDESIATGLIESAVVDMVKLIAPYYIQENRAWQLSKFAETAFGYFKTGLYMESLENLISAMESNNAKLSKNPEEEAKILYDAGLLCELLGDLSKAEANYKKAISRNSDPFYMQALANVRKTAADRMKLDNLNNK